MRKRKSPVRKLGGGARHIGTFAHADRVFGQTPILLRFKTGILFELTFVKSGYVTTKKLHLVSPRQGQKITAQLPRAGSRGNTGHPKR